MFKNPFDQFSKQLLEQVLSPFGTVETSHEVSGEAQFVDVYFEPSSHPGISADELGLLGRITQTPCLLEPFKNQPASSEIRSCLLKLFQAHGDYQRKSKREQESLQEKDLPYLDSRLIRIGESVEWFWGYSLIGRLGFWSLFSVPLLKNRNYCNKSALSHGRNPFAKDPRQG